ncbi:hypothetical protein AAY473_040346 [Plecturocebus cupreus]
MGLGHARSGPPDDAKPDLSVKAMLGPGIRGPPLLLHAVYQGQVQQKVAEDTGLVSERLRSSKARFPLPELLTRGADVGTIEGCSAGCGGCVRTDRTRESCRGLRRKSVGAFTEADPCPPVASMTKSGSNILSHSLSGLLWFSRPAPPYRENKEPSAVCWRLEPVAPQLTSMHWVAATKVAECRGVRGTYCERWEPRSSRDGVGTCKFRSS